MSSPKPSYKRLPIVLFALSISPYPYVASSRTHRVPVRIIYLSPPFSLPLCSLLSHPYTYVTISHAVQKDYPSAHFLARAVALGAALWKYKKSD